MTWNANGGTVSPSTSSFTYGTTLSQISGAAPKPTRTGYTFGGWYWDEAYTDPLNAAESQGATVDYDATFYAKWTGGGGAAFFAYAYYLGAEDEVSADGTTGGIYRVNEPGGEWVVGIPCPEGYRARGGAQWTEDVSNPLQWWAAFESGKENIAACCSCDAYFNAHFDPNGGRMVQPFENAETLAECLLRGVGNALGVEDLEIEDARYLDTDKYDDLFKTLKSLGVLQRRGEVRLKCLNFRWHRIGLDPAKRCQ